MKGKRGVPTTFGKTAMFEKLRKHRGPLKESRIGIRTTEGIGWLLTQDHRY
jgi:hypothetical protein